MDCISFFHNKRGPEAPQVSCSAGEANGPLKQLVPPRGSRDMKDHADLYCVKLLYICISFALYVL